MVRFRPDPLPVEEFEVIREASAQVPAKWTAIALMAFRSVIRRKAGVRASPGCLRSAVPLCGMLRRLALICPWPLHNFRNTVRARLIPSWASEGSDNHKDGHSRDHGKNYVRKPLRALPMGVDVDVGHRGYCSGLDRAACFRFVSRSRTRCSQPASTMMWTRRSPKR